MRKKIVKIAKNHSIQQNVPMNRLFSTYFIKYLNILVREMKTVFL